MLTISQVATVAFLDDGEILCPSCAQKRHGSLAVARSEARFSGAALEPMSEYGLGEWEGEDAWQQAEGIAQETGQDTQEVYDDEDFEYHVPCCACGNLWTGGGPNWVEDEADAVREVQPGDQRWLW